ncbi:MAG: PAS domain S-box protein [Desulfuromonadales bacterium]
MALLTSLKRALTLHFLLVGFLPVLLFGLVSTYLVAEQQLRGVRERNMSQARGIAEEVDAFLMIVQSDLQHVQQTIEGGLVVGPDHINQFLSSVVENSPFFEAIYHFDLALHLEHYGLMPQAKSLQHDDPRIDFSDHQLFRDRLALREPRWSNTYVSPVTGEPAVALVLPIADGYLLGNVRLTSLGKLLRSYTEYADTEVAVIDQNGSLVAHSLPSLALENVNFGDHPTVITAMQGRESTQEFEHADHTYLESATRLETPEWSVWVGLNMNAVNAPIARMRNVMLGFMAAAGVLACGIALFNVRRLMRPLTSLGDSAAQIGSGHYHVRVAPSGFSEIDALADQISNMSEAIQTREESIITKEQRFRDLVNSIDGIVWEMEYPSFRFLFVSRQAEAILGYPVSDWYERDDFWSTRIHPDDRHQTITYCRQMTEKQEDYDFEFRMLAVNDQEVWIRNLVTVVLRNNRPVRLLGVMIDVTTQKELLEELRRNEENYREIFNATSDALLIHEAESGRVVDVNQAMLSMFNCSYEEALSGGIAALSAGSPPYTHEDAQRYLQQTMRQGSCVFEWKSRKMSGEIFWTEVQLRSAMIGKHHRIIAAVRDISARKDAAGKLREVNERLLLLIERMPLGCILWSADFAVEMWNPMAERIFGFAAREMIGRRPFGKIVSAAAEPEVMIVWQRLKSGDTTAHSVNQNITRDGATITCEWFNTPMKDAAGSFIGVISMVQDVSERQSAENELARYRSHLEDLVRERSEQLQAAQTELMQKERLAILGQLTATVSHEIRNPLGTVANALYLLKQALNPRDYPQLARPLQLAERNVERCDTIISDLLDFSRQRAIDKVPLAIDPWLAELLAEIRFPEDVVLRQELQAGVEVPADAERLRRVIINVVTNALQALEDVTRPEKWLMVRSRLVGDIYEICIEDNGPGMSQSTLQRIFEPMFSTKNFGVGLGVPIIRNILENHGGGVEYRSQVDEGTLVIMWLPLAGPLPDGSP